MTGLPEALKGLEPAPVWRHFAELAARPRPSGQEEAVRQYVLDWAASHGFSTSKDTVGNVVVRVPARGDGAGKPTVIVQGHLDMVCEKNAGVDHDFETDPIQLRRVGERIFANQTTLGADNGIGVALGLAAGEGLFAHHPPLELLLTVDEETGMSGARELDASMLTATRMINLDAEEEGVLYVGCAGGQDTIVTADLERGESDPQAVAMQVRVKGLRGGHSGLDIVCNRGNAIRLLAHTLRALELPHRLVHIEGGSKRNAIPREASAVIQMSAQDAENLAARLEVLQAELYGLHADSESQLVLESLPATVDVAPLTPDWEKQVLDFLFTVPMGVVTMSQAVDGLVETSNNLGVVEMDGDALRVVLCSRSSNMGALRQVTVQITAVAELCGLNWHFHGGYPGWQPDMHSAILAISKDVFQQLDGGKEPEVTAIHAGLECGLLGSISPGLDMIAFGPDIQDAHSPDESVSIPSVGVVAKQVEALLAALCSR